jgi:hypothetical protein
MLILAGAVLALLVVLVDLLVRERDGTALNAPAPIPGLPGPRQ